MRTDLKRKAQAIELRKNGMSVKAIAQILAAAQSSVSIWVRGIELSNEQKGLLKSNTHSQATIEKRRVSRLKHEATKRSVIIDAAYDEIGSINRRELLLISAALYWAEGAKTRMNFQFSNGDPAMIKLMLRFFREICAVDESKLRGYIHIHEHLDARAAEIYWQSVTNLPPSQFFKTYNKPNKSSKGTRNSLPYGVCDIYVMDAHLLYRLRGWMKAIADVSSVN